MDVTKHTDSTGKPQGYVITEAYVAARGGNGIKYRNQLLKMPKEESVPPLVSALREVKTRSVYARLVTLLADIGGNDAFSVLKEQAWLQRYPRLTTRALASCNHPQVETAILELIHKGHNAQRNGAALAYAHTSLLRSITLCAECMAQGDPAAPYLLKAFRTIGRAEDVARLVLKAPGYEAPQRLRSLTFLAGLPFGFRLFRFDLDRFLLSEAEQQGSDITATAKAVLALRVAQQTLLRPAQALSESYLLHPSIAPNDTPNEQLLHPSSVEDVVTAKEAPAWHVRLRNLIRRWMP